MENRDLEEASSHAKRAEEMEEDEPEEEAEGEEEYDDEEGEEGLESAEFQYYLQAVGEIDPLGFPEDDAPDLQQHHLFERSDYEALASKKRKSLKAGRRWLGILKSLIFNVFVDVWMSKLDRLFRKMISGSSVYM